MANIGEPTRFNNPALAAFAQKMAQARAGNTQQTPAAIPAPIANAETAVKENKSTAETTQMAVPNKIEETTPKPEGAFVRKGMFLDIRV